MEAIYAMDCLLEYGVIPGLWAAYNKKWGGQAMDWFTIRNRHECIGLTPFSFFFDPFFKIGESPPLS